MGHRRLCHRAAAAFVCLQVCAVRRTNECTYVQYTVFGVRYSVYGKCRVVEEENDGVYGGLPRLPPWVFGPRLDETRQGWLRA